MAETIKVLIVDDDEGFRRTTARILARNGYWCIEASSSAEALRVLDNDKGISVALCDVMMPGTSGIELLAELSSRHPAVAVVMTTGLDDPRVAEEAFALGALSYLTKPFKPNALLINLANVIRLRNLEGAGESSGHIRVLVVDDHAIFAHSLVRLLESKARLKVVGTADSVASAVAASIEFRPDIVLMDFELPDGDGPKATELIKALMPAVHVIMLTARTDDQALARAIAAGCSGFVKKVDSTHSLFAAIVAAYEGESVVAASELAPLLAQLPPTHRGLGGDLTKRELEVLRLMARGLLNKQVARLLGLQLNTVRNHSQNILYKLEVHSRLEAVATAVRDGIIAYPSNSAAS